MAAQELQRIYGTTIRSLAFDEAQVALDIVEANHWDDKSRTAYWRAPLFDLVKVIQEITTVAKTQIPRRINLFCDAIVIKGSPVIDVVGPTGTLIAIYTRKVIVEGAKDLALTFRVTDKSALGFYCYHLPDNFKVRFEGDGVKEDRVLQVADGKFGVRGWYRNQKLDVLDFGAPEVEMENMDYMNRINPDGTSNETDWVDDYLPRILQFQFLVACTQIEPNPKLALSILNYICAATQEATQTIDFNIQCSSLLSSLIARQSNEATFLPSVNIHSSKQILKGRLVAARAFEDAFRAYVSRSSETGHFASATQLVLQRSEDAVMEYTFLESRAGERFGAAAKAYDESRRIFAETQGKLDHQAKEFQAGIDKWVKEQKIEAAKEIFFAAVELVGAIGATVATFGAAAPLAAGVAAKTVSTAGKIAQTVARIKELVLKIKKIFEQLKPVLEKLQSLATAVKKIISVLAEGKELSEKPGRLVPAGSSDDLVNASAQWEVFTVDVNMMFQELASYDIGGKSQYERLLRYLPIHGKAVLVAQAALIQTGDDLINIKLKKKLENNQRDRVEAALEHINADARIVYIMKRSLFDRLLAIRSYVYMDFWSYVAAYKYHSLARYSPIALSATKPAYDYEMDASKLQGAIATFSSSTQVQQKWFTIRTLGSFESANELVDALKSAQTVDFAVDHEDQQFDPFYRIRLRRVRCYLEGVKTASTDSHDTNLQLLVASEARFTDKTSKMPTDNSSDIQAYVGDERKVLFEYNPTSSAITCDGDFNLEESYVRFTPFTNWSIKLGKGGIKVADLDFSGFTGLKLEFWCDISLCAE